MEMKFRSKRNQFGKLPGNPIHWMVQFVIWLTIVLLVAVAIN
ncbi:hypothetical protein [Flavobacterium sp.]|nr:hypothetical protein [Flavobacterium sp.]